MNALKFINTLNMVSSKIKSSPTLSTKSFTWAFLITDSKTSLLPHHLTIHLWKSHCQWALALCVPSTNIFVLAVPCAQPLHVHSNKQRCIYTSCRCLISNHRNCLWATKDVYILPKSLTSATTQKYARNQKGFRKNKPKITVINFCRKLEYQDI